MVSLARRIRAAGHSCDVIAVTSARDVDVVRRAVAQGVVSYLIKPFTFAGFRTKLEQYVRYREQMAASDTSGNPTSTPCWPPCGRRSAPRTCRRASTMTTLT